MQEPPGMKPCCGLLRMSCFVIVCDSRFARMAVSSFVMACCRVRGRRLLIVNPLSAFFWMKVMIASRRGIVAEV